MLGYFLQDLFDKGEAVVQPELQQFDASDLAYAQQVLEAYYKKDAENLASGVPPFNPYAALWAAKFVYHSMQFLLLRQLNAEAINNTLHSYTHAITPEVVHSADLTLRYLPDLLNAARGLAPDDVLVLKLQQTAAAWHYSAVGTAIENVNVTDAALGNNALRIEYIDRIVARRDKHSLKNLNLKNMITEALSIHSESLWPGFKEL